MRTTSGYTYRAGDSAGIRHLKLIATPVGQGLLLSGVSAAQAADGSVQVTYTVSGAAQVSVDVLNIAGRVVGQLGSRAAGAGSINTVAWNGRNTQGAKVPSGRYMLRITARAENGQAAQCVRAFTLGR